MIHGRHLILSIGGTPIAGAKGCSMERETDTIEVCSPTDGAEQSYIPSTTGWSVSANGLYANKEKANILRKIWRQRQAVTVQYTTPNLDGKSRQVETGTAILTKLSESGEVGGLVKFSIKLQGSGKLKAETLTEVAFDAVRGKRFAGLEPGVYDIDSGTGTVVLTIGTTEYDRVEGDVERITLTEGVAATGDGNIKQTITKVVVES